MKTQRLAVRRKSFDFGFVVSREISQVSKSLQVTDFHCLAQMLILTKELSQDQIAQQCSFECSLVRDACATSHHHSVLSKSLGFHCRLTEAKML